jgi:hypothetical protein
VRETLEPRQISTHLQNLQSASQRSKSPPERPLANCRISTSPDRPPDSGLVVTEGGTSNVQLVPPLLPPMHSKVLFLDTDLEFVSSQEFGSRESSYGGEGESDYSEEDEDDDSMEGGKLDEMLQWRP